jgi:hypothetical protein
MSGVDYEALNTSLLEAELALRALPGAELANIEIFLDEVDDTDEYVRFHLGKLQVVRAKGDRAQILNVTHAPLRLRLRIVELLPEIKSRIEERAGTLAARVVAATRAAQAFAGGAR